MSQIITIRNRSEIAPILDDIRAGRRHIVSRECKHASYSVDRTFSEPSDMLSIKEYLTLDNNIRIPNMTFKKDYERPYWVTKKHLRTHPDKIEFESLDNLDMFRSTQIKLKQDICSKLQWGNPQNQLRILARSPYLYGLDVGPEVFVKQGYMDKWPDSFVPNHVTVIDAETDMTVTWKKPLLWSRVTDDEIVLYISNEWAKSVPGYEDYVREEFYYVLDSWLEHIRNKLRNKRSGEYPAFVDRPLTMPLRMVTLEDHFGITKGMMDDIHNEHTDIITGWNFFYDAQCISDSAMAVGVDPVELFADPNCHPDYKSMLLKEGAKYRISASGVKTNLAPQEQWHTMLATATYKMTCAMQTHWQLRKAKGKETGGYGLDAIGQRHLGAGKVNFKDMDSDVPPNTSHWHFDMQKNHKVRYGVYSIFDSILVKIKDWKDQDMESQISALSGACDYSRFNSQPTVNVADMLFSGIKNQRKVICSTSDQMEDENDKRTLGLHNWIVTFGSHNVFPTGLKILKRLTHVRSMVYMYCSDADVETTYPTVEIIANLGKETTISEPCQIEGISPDDVRIVAVNLTGGPVNAIETLQMTSKLRPLQDWLDIAKKELIV